MLIVIACITLSMVTNAFTTVEYGSRGAYSFQVLNQGRWSGMTKWGIGSGGIIIRDFAADEKTWSHSFVAGNWYWIIGYCDKFKLIKPEYINGYRVGYSSDAVVYLGFQSSDGSKFECVSAGKKNNIFTNWITVSPDSKMIGIEGTTNMHSIQSIKFQFEEIPPKVRPPPPPPNGVCEPDISGLEYIDCYLKSEAQCDRSKTCIWDSTDCIAHADETIVDKCEKKTKEDKCTSNGNFFKCIWIEDNEEMLVADEMEQILFTGGDLDLHNDFNSDIWFDKILPLGLMFGIVCILWVVWKCYQRKDPKGMDEGTFAYGSVSGV